MVIDCNWMVLNVNRNGFAIWIKTKEEKVLLQRDKNATKYQRKNLFGPLKEWVSREEYYTHQLSRMVHETMAKLGMECKLQFSKEPIEKEEIGPDERRKITRYHFLCQIIETDTSLTSISHPDFLLVGKKDLSQIKEHRKTPRNSKNKIILFDKDYQILIENVFQVVKKLTTFIF